MEIVYDRLWRLKLNSDLDLGNFLSKSPIVTFYSSLLSELYKKAPKLGLTLGERSNSVQIINNYSKLSLY